MTNDHTESLEIAGRLRDTIQTLHDLADQVGQARQVKEFASDRRKNLLARYIKPFLDQGDSATKAEFYARCEPGFLEDMKDLEEQQTVAEKTIARYDAARVRAEAARSLLSYSRQVMDTLQG